MSYDSDKTLMMRNKKAIVVYFAGGVMYVVTTRHSWAVISGLFIGY